ncbi:sphingomyelin phosphodiesterase [Streptomyces sp. SID6139]|uniref:endonuclease/exonuclease/phosphatase family protein n=1 Tax=Streptomyces sp. SID6139 TaxID=2690320 RepID=UPI00136B312E|nr:sphingomyelin phosphodiesterase [Streptomyces sp. SID6139]
MTILSYNTMLLPPSPSSDTKWDQERRASRIGDADFLGGHDIILLQEIFSHGEVVLQKLTGKGYKEHTPIVGETTQGWDKTEGWRSGALYNGGVAIVSKHNIVQKEQVIYNDYCGWDSATAKGFAYAKLDMRGKFVHVIATHTQSDDTSSQVLFPGCGSIATCKNLRKKQFNLINKFISEKENSRVILPEETVIIGGDMNVDRYSEECKEMAEILQVDTSASSGYIREGALYSYDTHTNTIAKERDPEGARQDLDYIFLRKGHPKPETWHNRVMQTPPNAWTMKTAAQRWYTYDDLSDHYPLEAGPGTGCK